MCDGIDNDCNGLVDDTPADGVVLYADADGDGFGDPALPLLTCSEVDGFVSDATDCDDTSDLALPGGTEVCDGLDNDCDGTTDANTVPGDFVTIQDAIDGLADGDEICVGAGTWSEPFDLSGRALTLVGAGGADATSLQLSSAELPFVTASDTPKGGQVALRGFTVTGMDAVAGNALAGGFLYASDGVVALTDVVLDGNRYTVLDDAYVFGGLVHTRGGSLTLTDVAMSDLEIELLGTHEDSFPSLEGGALYTLATTLEVDGLDVSDVRLTTDGVAGCWMRGVVLAVDGGAPATMHDVTASEVILEATCDYGAGVQGAVAALRGQVALSDWYLHDVSATLTAESAGVQGVLFADDLAGTIDGMELRDNTLTATSLGDYSGFVTGSATLEASTSEPLAVSHLTVIGNTTSSVGPSWSFVMGGGLYADGGTYQWLDVRDNTALASDTAVGGGAYLSAWIAPLAVTQAIVAGNTSGGTDTAYALAGGLALDGSRIMEVQHVDIVGNDAVATEWASAGGLFVVAEGELHVQHSNISHNTVSAPETSAAAVSNQADQPTSWATTNVWGNTGASALAGFDTDPSTVSGNLVQDPLHTDLSPADPEQWDLTLQASSPLLEADVGAYGGKDGASW
ncbi:MAG: hypothetical protein KTR31_20080 [Myxococcales bacterium]|nr:hypothetical protein [Myxococcales bacterium]